jgi:hypothetical protein
VGAELIGSRGAAPVSAAQPRPRGGTDCLWTAPVLSVGAVGAEHVIEAVVVPPRDSGAPSVAPAAGWASGALGVVQAVDREIAQLMAVRARAVAEFAGSRPGCAGTAASTTRHRAGPTPSTPTPPG